MKDQGFSHALQDDQPNAELRDDVMLPEGWEDMDFPLPEMTPDAANGVEAQSSSDDAEAADHTTDADESTDTGKSANPPDADPEPAPDEDSTETAKTTYTLRVNHKDITVELTPDELVARLQKSYAHEEREKKEAYRKAYEEQLNQGMTDVVAKLVAKEAAGGVYSLEDEEEPEPEHLNAQIAQIRDIYPDFDTMPLEVMKAVQGGENAVTAYVRYRNQQFAKQAETLKQEANRENAILKQNARATAKAPVKGVSGSPVPDQREDPFLAGFDKF